MKSRSLLALIALACLSWNASAQRAQPSRSAKKPVAAQQYGAVQRTKLLEMGRRRSDGRQLGSVQRTALLTTGRALKLPTNRSAYR